MSQKTGLLLDVSGIQRYIFGTNRLKQIVGASGNIRTVIAKNDEEDTFLDRLLNGKGDIIYSGGGNALLLFNSEEDAKDFSQRWSMKILEDYPGIQPAVGLCTYEYNKDNFEEFLKVCREQLRISKAINSANLTLPRYGLTAECVYTGSSAQCYNNEIKTNHAGGNEYYSIIAKTKDNGYDAANDRFYKEYNQDFSENFEDLAGTTGDNYRSGMAIVHIDGNDIGDMFSKLITHDEFESSSKKVRRLFSDAMKFVINDIAEINNKYQKDLGLKKGVFPFRPIIVGGDDITYVCHASLGLWSAYSILKNLAKQQMGEDNPITACAGIAFTKPSYPFATGYALAEELCEEAKKKRRKGGDKSRNISFLDFHIMKGGAFSDLETVREHGYQLANKSLIGRPFGIEKGQEAFDWLVETGRGMVKGNENNKWPKNKIKELREVVYKGKSAIKAFYTHMKSQGKKIPKLESRDPREELGIPTELDLCEFLDVYPKWLFEWNNIKNEEAGN